MFTPFGTILMKTSPVIMMRIAGPSGAQITKSEVATIQWEVWNIQTNAQTGALATLDPDDVVFDSLVLDDLWGDYDEQGYNFKHTIPDGSGLFPTANVYQIDYKFTLTSGAIGRAWAQIKTLRTYISV